MDGREPGWMTVPEVAAALGVSLNTMRLWIQHGELPGERHNEPHESGALRYRVRRADVRAFAELHYTGKTFPAWLDEA